jgi:hypothetical protein
MLSLTTEQLNLIKQATTMLPACDRNNFFKSLAAQLSRKPSDGEVASALSFILSGRGISVDPSLFLRERPRRGSYARR